MIENGLLLYELIANNLDKPEKSPIWRIVTKAHARWKLDTDQILDKTDLVLLSGLSEQSIKNRLSGKKPEINGTTRRIEAKEALAWLSFPRRKKFVSSIWRKQTGKEYASGDNAEYEPPIFVPVARDGTQFNPGLERDGVFTVGRGVNEKQFADFDSALAELQSMSLPTWLRPNSFGEWTHVSGIKWVRAIRPKSEAPTL